MENIKDKALTSKLNRNQELVQSNLILGPQTLSVKNKYPDLRNQGKTIKIMTNADSQKSEINFLIVDFR